MSDRIGNPIPRIDASEKISGSAAFIADLKWDGMIYARTLRSTRPRARIKAVEIPELPPDYDIVDRTDVPGKNRVKMLAEDFPFFAEEVVNYIGEPILLVVGPDKETITRILSEIRVQYEELEPIYTLEQAEAGQVAPLYGDNNLFAEYRFSYGEPERLLDLDDPGPNLTMFTDEYRTGYQEHVYLEPQGVVGLYADDRISVYGSMQCPYYVKNALIEGFGWDERRIRVVQTTTGGAFGGKEEFPSLIAGHVAFAAYKTGRPVQLVFDRQEDILCTTKRHPSTIRFKTAVDQAGSIKAMSVDILLDGGAYAGLTSVVLQRAIFAAVGAYRIPAVEVQGRAFATNTVPTGAFRGFGAPQAFFAIEMHMNNLAIRLGEDPLEFKKRHMVRTGDRTITGGTFRDAVKLDEMIETAKKMSGYEEKFRAFSSSGTRSNLSSGTRSNLSSKTNSPSSAEMSLSSNSNSSASSHLKGIGISLFFHGCGFTGSGERDHIKAKVRLVKRRDGTVEIRVANVDMGQGAQTTLRKVVAKTLELPIERTVYDNPDTDRVPDSGPTVASRTAMIVGHLLEQAASELKQKWDTNQEIEVESDYRHPDHLEWDQDSLKGDAYPTYSWGVNVVEVEVDCITYETRIKGVWGVYDVGAPLDENVVKGQIDGGIAQGLGYATLEVMESRQGAIQQGNFTDYIIPTSLDLPPVESRLIDNPYEGGPFGAKGAGELPLIGAAPALAAAVGQAVGARVDRIPVTPEYLLEIVEHRGENS
jgi:CO/xanthine dehydrogenase Mo-binding subunit